MFGTLAPPDEGYRAANDHNQAILPAASIAGDFCCHPATGDPQPRVGVAEARGPHCGGLVQLLVGDAGPQASARSGRERRASMAASMVWRPSTMAWTAPAI